MRAGKCSKARDAGLRARISLFRVLPSPFTLPPLLLDPLPRQIGLRVAHFQLLQLVDDGAGHEPVPIPLGVRGHDDPGRRLRGGLANGVFVGALVVVPEPPLIEVAMLELPALATVAATG